MKYVNTTSIQMENVLPDPLCFNEGPTAYPHARQTAMQLEKNE